MTIDLNDYSPEEAERIIRADIWSRGLDPSTMRFKIDDIQHDEPTRKMSFTVSFVAPAQYELK
ncbi:hypothetical protein [Pseudomonas sp. MWU12-2345]|uniref:hypothetical protein n=1 Tax=Pseudomonas sp. MWU12-2345 TaxID=2928689 RepID=UPI00200FBB9C|nr:hypothetical protein [Pseudomonas sp. MWU12-2345]